MNAFATLGVPDRLVLDSATIEERWKDATLQSHPDRQSENEATGQFAEVNLARSILEDPARRLEHWLKQKAPELTPDRTIAPELMDLFSTLSQTLATVDDVLSRHQKASTALAKALLAKEAIQAQLDIQSCLQQILPLKTSILDRFEFFELEATNGNFEEASRGLGQLQFLRKWEQQCQNRLLALIEC